MSFRGGDQFPALIRNKELVATDGSRSKAKGRVTLSDPYTAIFPGGVHTAKRIEGSNWVWDYINMPDGKLYVRRLQRTGTHSGRPKQESQG